MSTTTSCSSSATTSSERTSPTCSTASARTAQTLLFLVEEVPYDEASRYGVCRTNEFSEIVELIEKPDDPPSNLVMTGFYTFTLAIFHACQLVQPSDRGENELLDALDPLI